jgi:hypothetical protein
MPGMIHGERAVHSSTPNRRSRGFPACIWAAVLCIGALPALFVAAGPAAALSEIQREELPAPANPPANPPVPEGDMAPPAPSTEPAPGQPGSQPSTPGQPASPEDQKQPAQPNAETPSEDGGVVNPRVDPDAPLPQVFYDLAELPEPVRRMHGLLIEACKSGDIEKLRPLIGSGDSMTQLSLTDIEGDPIAFLKGLSGDSEGQEILAIMEEVLNAGYVHLDAGKPEELYVWPYFFAMPLDKLDARQRVELFKIVTASDYEDMKQFGAYIFYRVGITPEGRWAFFVAGD